MHNGKYEIKQTKIYLQIKCYNSFWGRGIYVKVGGGGGLNYGSKFLVWASMQVKVG